MRVLLVRLFLFRLVRQRELLRLIVYKPPNRFFIDFYTAAYEWRRERFIPMQSNMVSRFALKSAMTMAACLTLNAQAQAPVGPVIGISPVDGTVISKSALPANGFVPVVATATDASGLRSLSLSGGYSSGRSSYPTMTKTGSVTVNFFVGYFAVGDYKFTASATNYSNVTTTKSIILHVQP